MEIDIDIRTIIAFSLILLYDIVIVVGIFYFHRIKKQIKKRDTAIEEEKTVFAEYNPLLDKWVEGENKDC